jgi:hypothetical protein
MNPNLKETSEEGCTVAISVFNTVFQVGMSLPE